ncbi:hypothetical protein J14TS2_06640 [Bacillus sp. J14TS2]|nr:MULTISPECIES: YezD family protein [unclassified Bacillus (in: firmicutes)]MBO0995107.1 YezD family protein [Bacillus sp. SD088]GIN70189.1 hypothetical protein J14TS2_06640 [Bacillus sp. J14TS2]
MSKQKENLETAIEVVKEYLNTMKYGSITLVVQDQHVVQIEKNEKVRLK